LKLIIKVFTKLNSIYTVWAKYLSWLTKDKKANMSPPGELPNDFYSGCKFAFETFVNLTSEMTSSPNFSYCTL
jgi:hypothetical protein